MAIGPDISYTSRNDATERAKICSDTKVNRRSPVRGRAGSIWPVDDFRQSPRAVESIGWTHCPFFTVGLVQRGHRDDAIRKILGENGLRVARANWVEQPV